jgi:hypothetical protein
MLWTLVLFGHWYWTQNPNLDPEKQIFSSIIFSVLKSLSP